MNTIYEDYIKISDRLFLFQEGRYNWQPMCKAIRISNYMDFDLFILKSNKGYMLCEGLTGCVLLYQSSLNSRILRRMCLRQFIKSLPGILDQRGGTATINQAIINFIFDNDQRISPRYKSKENDRLQEV